MGTDITKSDKGEDKLDKYHDHLLRRKTLTAKEQDILDNGVSHKSV